jgi:hypothetical protein
MSSQVTLGTSTTVSRSALGLDMPSAVLKWSWGTDMGRWVGSEATAYQSCVALEGCGIQESGV